MRITQGYVSKSIMDFYFHQIYGLDDYNSTKEPAVFFGCYRYEDIQLINNHRADKIVFWTGQDALDFNDFGFSGRTNNFTAHPKVADLLRSKGFKCNLVKPASFLNGVNPQILGPKIYAYCPSSAPDYHGKKIINELRYEGYEIIIGDGTIPQSLWKNACNGYYNDIFVGLCLSEFAGGGGSIIEMGLRGIPVITNVFSLPHCIPWNSTQDIMTKIDKLKQHIGTTKVSLSNDVWNSLDHEYEWLNI